MHWLWCSVCWRWLTAGCIWQWGPTQRNKDGCSWICHPFLAAYPFPGTLTLASSFICWSLVLWSPLGETSCASIQVSLLSGGAGKTSLPSLQHFKWRWENEREGWVFEQDSSEHEGARHWCKELAPAWGDTIGGAGRGCKHRLGSVGLSQEGGIIHQACWLMWCYWLQRDKDLHMLPPALHFPPSWRENFTAVASGRVGDSAALLCCHLGLEPAARKNVHNYYLAEFPSAHAPPSHTQPRLLF